MSKAIIRKQFLGLRPLRAKLFCAFDQTGTWFAKRPELVFRGSHRYARWCCEECGRTPQNLKRFGALRAATLAAFAAGPGTLAWSEYERLQSDGSD